MAKLPDIVRLRLQNQLLGKPSRGKPEEVVRHLVAMQAQDYFGALWAVGLRLVGSIVSDIENAFNEGLILRTHIMRPTWHFVAAQDIHWLQKLTAPRVHAQNAYMYRQNNLDAKVFTRTHDVIEKSLADGKALTRNELKRKLEIAKIKTTNLRLAYIVMHAELDGLICSGPRQGKQFTYALLDERVPKTGRELNREGSLAQFVLRFFTARGPATTRDFAYWSGLTIADGKAGIEIVKGYLSHFESNGSEYWCSKEINLQGKTATIAYLLPNYDEFGMSYKNHGVTLDEKQKAQLLDFSFTHLIVIDGQLVGTWRRGLKKNEIEVELWPFEPLSTTERRLIENAAKKYQEFLQRPVRIIN